MCGQRCASVLLSRIWLVGLTIWIVTACQPQESPEALPTITLVVVTATQEATATIVIPKATSSPRLEPGSLLVSMTPVVLQAILPSSALSDGLVSASLIQQMMSELAQELDVDRERVQVARLISSDPLTSFPCNIQPASLTDAITSYRQWQPVGRYRLSLLVGLAVHEYELTGDGAVISKCGPARLAEGELLLAVDPVLAELAALARQRVAQALDLPVRRIQFISAVVYTWPDTSLGCPRTGQEYTAGEIDGYRIVVSAGDREYIFHTDSVGLFACEAGQEQLPPAPAR